MFIITQALSVCTEDVELRESGSVFCEMNHFLKFKQIKWKAWKHGTEKYHDQTMKFTPPAVGLTPFHSVSLHHTFVVHNLILSCLTGSYLTTSLKSNYCVRPKVNLNIADSISFYFNFGKTIHLQQSSMFLHGQSKP